MKTTIATYLIAIFGLLVSMVQGQGQVRGLAGRWKGERSPVDNKPIRLECEYDCDKDADCADGLLCADEHKEELKRKGLDPRKAYCKGTDKPGPGFKKINGAKKEVCYDPKKV